MDDIRPVRPDEWTIVEWLWQAYRNDLAVVLESYPYPDGRYKYASLRDFPGSAREGYLAWSPHPNLGEPAPVAFALVDQVGDSCQSLAQLFVVPAARRAGLGRRLAVHVLAQHPGRWQVAFQHRNETAGKFWRSVWDEVFGENWTEERTPVPGRRSVPPDHWLRSG